MPVLVLCLRLFLLLLLLCAAAGAGHLKLQDFITMFNGVDAEPPAMPEQVRKETYPIKLSMN
jgi:hypothetical protein|eukprot:COSAG06_NODE_186_length_20792_cov_1041.487443_4_plen_62_part_00